MPNWPKLLGNVLSLLFVGFFVIWISQSLRLGLEGNAEMFQRLGSVAVAFVIFFFGLFHYWHSIFADASKVLLSDNEKWTELQMTAQPAESPVGDRGIGPVPL